MGHQPSKTDRVNAHVSVKDSTMAASNKNLSMSLSFSSQLSDGNGYLEGAAGAAGAAGQSGVAKHSKDAPSYEALNTMVREMGGDRPVHSVLVANNGLAAVKFMRSVRNWAFKRFGDERAIKLIAMATPEDMLADAEHIRLADQFIEVAGGALLFVVVVCGCCLWLRRPVVVEGVVLRAGLNTGIFGSRCRCASLCLQAGT